MSTQAPARARRLMAAFLMLALSLAGAGRGWAAAPDGGGSGAALAAPICHAHGSPGPDLQHDCCAACTLCAPATLPGAPGLTAPVRVLYVAARSAAVTPTLVPLRPRTPRLAQGPPPT